MSSRYSGGLGRGELAGRFSGLGELELTALDEESINEIDLQNVHFMYTYVNIEIYRLLNYKKNYPVWNVFVQVR